MQLIFEHLCTMPLITSRIKANVRHNPSFPNLFFRTRINNLNRRGSGTTTSSGCSVFSSKPRIPKAKDGRCSRKADAKPTTKHSGYANRRSKYRRRYLQTEDAKVNSPEAPWREKTTQPILAFILKI
jgi:hypothetical protein